MAKKEIPMMVVETRIKGMAKDIDKKMRCTGGFATALNGEVESLVNKAVERCKDNGRNTLKPQDL